MEISDKKKKKREKPHQHQTKQNGGVAIWMTSEYFYKKCSMQNNFEKGEQSWRYQFLGFQDILQSYSNQNSRVLGENIHINKWKQDREPRNKSTIIWSINL